MITELLTSEEAARMLGCRECTLALWRHRKTGPAYVRVGGRLIRYRRRDVLRWICSRRVITGAAKQ
jgi:predicted DNA-binding transcriptional regulator AlpA